MLDGCSLSSSTSTSTESDKSAQSRVLSSYFPEGPGSAQLGIYEDAMMALFRVLVSLPGLRRAPGAQGHLKSVPYVEWPGQVGRLDESTEEKAMYMTSDRSSFWPVPTTMNIVWNPN
jgi:hypothetical protein